MARWKDRGQLYIRRNWTFLALLRLRRYERKSVEVGVFRKGVGYLERAPSPPLDNIRVMVIAWRLRGNIIKTALCWIVWHNVHSPQLTCEQFLQVQQIGFVALGPLRCV